MLKMLMQLVLFLSLSQTVFAREPSCDEILDSISDIWMAGQICMQERWTACNIDHGHVPDPVECRRKTRECEDLHDEFLELLRDRDVTCQTNEEPTPH